MNEWCFKRLLFAYNLLKKSNGFSDSLHTFLQQEPHRNLNCWKSAFYENLGNGPDYWSVIERLPMQPNHNIFIYVDVQFILNPYKPCQF